LGNVKRAQAGTEFLLLLAVAIVVITLMVLISQQQIGDVSKIKEQNDARNSVLDLSSAAKEVYAQGEGAKKQVYILLPSSYDPTKSYVANRTIRINARGTDYASLEDFDVHGSLPGTNGGQWVWVISEGNKVRIGMAMIELSKNSIYVIMNRNSSIGTSFSVTNIWNKNISVSQAIIWNNGNVTMSVSPSSGFSLAPDQSQNINLDFSASPDAVGFYNGEIDYTATEGANNDTVRLPITVEVVGFGSGIAPPLTVIPSLWNETMQPNTTSTKVFTVCTNTQTSLSGVSFTPSSGPPGSWVGGTTALGTMAAGSCQLKIMNLTVPAGTTPTSYNGNIQAVGQGVPGASDTITVSITVGGDPTDIIGPNVTGIIHLPSKIYTSSPVTFVITGSDSGSGNNTIKSCEVKADFGGWMQMAPTDGAFDQITEQATYTYSGFTLGDHTIQFRCTDFRNNVGPVATYTIKVMKNFLFATKTNDPSNSETDWMNWLATHLSGIGFNWQLDFTSDDNVANGLVNTTYYSVIVLADYQNNNNIVPKLQSFIAAGGRVIFLADSFQQGPRDVGLTNSPGTGGSSSGYIVTNNHYITGDYNTSQTVPYTGGQSQALKSFIGTNLVTTSSSQANTLLGVSGGYAVWGASAAGLNANGTDLSTHVFDYSLLQSTIQPQ
jgi:hypothetical protein